MMRVGWNPLGQKQSARLGPFKPLAAQPAMSTTGMATLAFCAAAVLAAGTVVTSRRLPASINYAIELAIFMLITTLFLLSRRTPGRVVVFEYPVYLTLLAFVQLGLAPVFVFIDPAEMGQFVTEDGLVRALLLCMIAMAAFWAGTLMFGRRGRTDSELTAGDANKERPLIIAIVLFVIGCAAKTYMLAKHMYSFVGSQHAVSENLGSVQALRFAAQFAAIALVVVAIEKFSSRKADRISFVFWPMLLIQCGWGLISGMKGELISNLVIVLAVATLARRKIPVWWFVAPVVALVLLYPAYNSYRSIVRGGGADVTDFASAADTGTRAIQSSEEMRLGHRSWIYSGIESALSRMNGLSSVAQILALGPYKAVLEGDERMWMLPIYPFVPRSIWKEKPILDKGARFSVLLGGTEETSIAVTYPADCFLLGGWLGVVGGMFAWGMLAEGLVRFLASDFSRKRLFIYVSLTATAVSSPIENTVFAFWSGFIKQIVALALIAFVIYGSRKVRPLRKFARVAVNTQAGFPLAVSETEGRR